MDENIANMYIQRIINLNELLKKKSFFLFGPRSTGKSLMIKEQLGDKALIINLLRNDIYIRLMENPSSLENMLPENKSVYVVIDEVQKIPELLDEVHRLIEDEGYTFLLTGSSARKLLRGNANLLAGRARRANLFPLTYVELKRAKKFKLIKYLLYGGLPQAYLSEEPREELMTYVSTYLDDEIQKEAFVRNITAFTRFLSLCASTNGEVVNFSSISNDSSVPVSTVREYYQILEDTLIGFSLPAWIKSHRTKTLKSPKFYLFDLGVANYLNKINFLQPQTREYANSFEHFIILEIRSFIDYYRKDIPMAYWRTSDGMEVDLIINDRIAIEIKSTEKVSNKHCSGLKALMRNKDCEQYIIISHDKYTKKILEKVKVYYWEDFLNMLWDNKIL